MRRALASLGSLLLLGSFAPAALGASDASIVLDRAPIDSFDFSSLQRGAKVYVNYCIGCHSLKYMRYARLEEDLGINPEALKANIAFDQELFAPMNSAMRTDDAREWFNQAVPPDLSLTARNRNPDWLYSYMKSFYRDPERPTGWNNTIFQNVSMPHVLQSQQGVYGLDDSGALVALSPGALSPAEYDTLVADLVNFLVYVGEPVKMTRHRIGYGVMIFLCFMLVLTYVMYREYWRDIK